MFLCKQSGRLNHFSVPARSSLVFTSLILDNAPKNKCLSAKGKF